MAFSYITDGEIDADIASCSAAMFTKMVLNMDGICQGDPGAPRLKIQAMPAPTAGNAVIREFRTAYGVHFLSTTYENKCFWPVIRTGTYRFRITLTNYNVGSNTIYGRIYRNGSPYGAERSLTGNGSATWTEDLSFTAGDQIQFYVRHTGGAAQAGAEIKCGVANPLRPIAKIL